MIVYLHRDHKIKEKITGLFGFDSFYYYICIKYNLKNMKEI